MNVARFEQLQQARFEQLQQDLVLQAQQTLSMQRFIKLQAGLYQKLGYSLLQGKILALLWLSSEPQSLQAIAKHLKVSKVMVSRVVNQLFEQKAVLVKRDASSRQHFVALPKAGFRHDLELRRHVGWQQALLAQRMAAALPRLSSRLEAQVQVQLQVVAALDEILMASTAL